MSTKLIALAVVAASAVTLSAAAAAGPPAKKQRVTITAAKGNDDAFVLKPVATGAISGDSGSVGWCCWSERFVMRNGQRIEINDPVETLVGKHGTLVLRVRIEWVNAGNSYTVGTGTWRVVRGTGAYKGVRGSGRQAALWSADTVLSFRSEGYLRRS
jgi:hypothetical protein